MLESIKTLVMIILLVIISSYAVMTFWNASMLPLFGVAITYIQSIALFLLFKLLFLQGQSKKVECTCNCYEEEYTEGEIKDATNEERRG